MTTCYFDAFSGISGDMTVGALIDAGANGDSVLDCLHSLNLGATYRYEKTKRNGLAATKFHVDGGKQKDHRHLPHIAKIIGAASAISATAKQNALNIFMKLGEAEAHVHGVPLDLVHFHEVGAVDSISDIVGACVALDLLGVTEIACSPINVGSGLVETEHGTLPVPAPATAELLKQKPIYAKGPAMELTTPTGAAIVATLATHFGAIPALSIQATGFGAGTADFKVQANVLRATIGQRGGAKEATTVNILEANIDDANPQILGYAMDRLFAAGALDVTLQPLQMKKNRPGTLLSVIAKPEDTDALAAIVLSETTTIGLRITTAERRVATRRFLNVETPWGDVRMKITAQGATPEYDDCRALAEAKGVPLKDVLAQAHYAYLKEF
jgi:pyridinium-3,5-bisthiocarboxylic acid mononucleotide nickel chelatase